MRHNRLALVVLAGLAVALVLSGCGRGNLVSVNGEKITKEEFYKRLETLPLGGNPAGLVILDQMINEKLILQLAKERAVEPKDEQIRRKLNFAKKEGSLNETLRQRGITQQEYEKELRVQQAFANIITKGVKVTEKEVQDYYNQNKDTSFTKPERVHIAAIICNGRENIGKAQQQIKQGQDFSTVALNLSEDPISRPQGGTLGWVWRGMKDVPPNLIETAFKLKVRQVSEPFQVKQPRGTDQWVMLKALDRKARTVLTYNDVKEQIREGLALEKGQRQMDIGAILKKQRKDAKIQIKTARYKLLEKVQEEKKAGKAGK